MVMHKPITGKGCGLAQPWCTPWGCGVELIPLKFTGGACQSSKEEGGTLVGSQWKLLQGLLTELLCQKDRTWRDLLLWPR